MVIRYPFKPRANEVLECLVSEYQWLLFLKERGKPYEKLLDVLVNTGQKVKANDDSLGKDDYQVTNIARNLTVAAGKVSKWIFAIYDDLFELNEKEPELFNNGGRFRYELSFETSEGKYNQFNLWTSIEINKHSSFCFPFMDCKVGWSLFFAESITLHHSYGEIITSISFREGSINIYRRLILDKIRYLEWVEEGHYNSYIETLSDFEERIKKYARNTITGI